MHAFGIGRGLVGHVRENPETLPEKAWHRLQSGTGKGYQCGFFLSCNDLIYIYILNDTVLSPYYGFSGQCFFRNDFLFYPLAFLFFCDMNNPVPRKSRYENQLKTHFVMKKTLLLAGVAALFAVNANAMELKPYVGLDYVRSDVDIDKIEIALLPGAPNKKGNTS